MPKAKKTTQNRSIRIRMYRVGFGDCFLLSLPVGDDSSTDYKHIVVDCGVHGKGNIRTIGEAVDDIGVETGGNIAAVIATHSHQDHISGFSDKFTKFKIQEVWLPWAEDKNDELARKWSKKQAALTALLEQHFVAQAHANAADASTPERQKALAALVNLTSDADAMKVLAGNDARAMEDFGKLTSNAKAMGLLTGGFNVGAKVGYFGAGNTIKDALGIPGLEVRFLGPPRDQTFLAKMDPPTGREYLQLDSNGTVREVNKLEPFPKQWLTNYPANGLTAPLTLKEETELQTSLSDTSLNALAFTLDSNKNNTSLVTLFIYRGKYLLFPGDAQYGNWMSWLNNDKDGEILSNINFLKVAHHGSHNATPKEALDGLTGDFAAMVSTQKDPWNVIPLNTIMERLDTQTKHRTVRSDWIDIAGAPVPLDGAKPIKPPALPSGFSSGQFWYDYQIDVP